MKKNSKTSNFIRSAALLLLTFITVPLLFGCGVGEGTVTTPITDPAVTKEPDKVTTEPEKTDAATEPQTTEPAETEQPAIVSPEEVDLSSKDVDLAAYFTDAHFCETEFTEDADEGRVLRVKTKNVKSPNTRAPYLFFNYKGLCDALGKESADISEKSCVLFKIRAEELHDRMFTLSGATSTKAKDSELTSVTAKIRGGEEWHYLCFDFSGAKKANEFAVFRISFEALAGKNDESLLISEFRVCTKEEAERYITPDVYEVKAQTAEDYTLNLLQFNIQTENGNSAPFIIRSEMYRQLVDRLLPDVVGMEEVTVTWRKWLDEYVFNDSYAGVGEPRSAGGEANPIYYRKDKFELVDSGTFWLSDTPDKSGSLTKVTTDGKEYKANYPRICTWVILRDKATGVEFAHMNTHLDHNGNNDSTVGNNIRKAQMAVIVKFAAQRFGDLPLFLTGDLNNRRTTGKGEIYALYKMITGDKTVKGEDGTTYKMTLADSRLDAPVTVDENHTATMSKYYDENNTAYEPTREPIDYAFYNPANTEALTYETFLISENGMEISDHLPVFATFRIKTTE